MTSSCYRRNLAKAVDVEAAWEWDSGYWGEEEAAAGRRRRDWGLGAHDLVGKAARWSCKRARHDPRVHALVVFLIWVYIGCTVKRGLLGLTAVESGVRRVVTCMLRFTG